MRCEVGLEGMEILPSACLTHFSWMMKTRCVRVAYRRADAALLPCILPVPIRPARFHALTGSSRGRVQRGEFPENYLRFAQQFSFRVYSCFFHPRISFPA